MALCKRERTENGAQGSTCLLPTDRYQFPHSPRSLDLPPLAGMGRCLFLAITFMTGRA